MTNRLRSWIVVAVSIVLIVTILYLTQVYWSKEQIATFITQFGPLSVVAYIAVVIAFNVAALLSASPIMLLGFSLFEQWAVWLFAVGNMAAMGINFWIARRFGRRFVRLHIGENDMQKMDKVAQEHGLATLFIIRMFVSGLNDIASYAFGLTPIKFKSYILVSIAASIPPILLFTFLSQHVQNPVHLLILQLIVGGAFTIMYFAARMAGQRLGINWKAIDLMNNQPNRKVVKKRVKEVEEGVISNGGKEE